MSKRVDFAAGSLKGHRLVFRLSLRASEREEVAIKTYNITARREIAAKAIAVGLSAVIGIRFATAQNKDSRDSKSLMHIHNLYADESGETHFRDIKIEPATEGPGGEVSGRFVARDEHQNDRHAEEFALDPVSNIDQAPPQTFA